MFDFEVHSCFFLQNDLIATIFRKLQEQAVLQQLEVACKMDVRYFESICFHGTPSLSLKELAFCSMSAYLKISMWSIICHNSLHKLLRLYSFKVLFMFISLRWTKPRKNKSVKNAKPKISAALNYRKKLVVKTNLSMRMNDIHALFMKKMER